MITGQGRDPSTDEPLADRARGLSLRGAQYSPSLDPDAALSWIPRSASGTLAVASDGHGVSSVPALPLHNPPGALFGTYRPRQGSLLRRQEASPDTGRGYALTALEERYHMDASGERVDNASQQTSEDMLSDSSSVRFPIKLDLDPDPTLMAAADTSAWWLLPGDRSPPPPHLHDHPPLHHH